MQFITFTTHRLDKNREVQYAPTRHNPAVGIAFGYLYTKGKVFLQLPFKAFTDMAAGTVLTFLTKEWRVVDGKEHGHRRLIYADRRQRFGILKVANRVTYLEAL